MSEDERKASMGIWPALGLALVLCACAGEQPSGQAAAQAKPVARAVQLVRVEKRELSRAVSVQGTLAPDEQVVVSTRVAGYLADLSVDLGSPVEKDQVLGRLEPQDFRLRVEQAKSAEGQARASLGLPLEATSGDAAGLDLDQTSAVRQARATLDEAKANLERAKQLRDKKLIAPAEFDTSNTAYLRAEAALETAREDIRTRKALLRQRGSELALAQKELVDASIRAPIAGVVAMRTASEGEFLQAGAPVVTVVRIDPLRLRVEVPERDAQSVRVGQPVNVRLEGDGEVYQGQIARVSPLLSAQNRTLTVEAEIKNPGNLRAGSFARAEIVVSSDAGLVVPEGAIVMFAGIEKLLTVEDGKAVEKAVSTGLRSAGFVEIKSGVSEGEQVVMEPGNLQQGQPVDVRH